MADQPAPRSADPNKVVDNLSSNLGGLLAAAHRDLAIAQALVTELTAENAALRAELVAATGGGGGPAGAAERPRVAAGG